MKIPITRPCITPEDLQGIEAVLQSGWITQGPVAARFEQAFATYTGAAHACVVSSCTAALHLALLALGIGKGDEVICPSFTFVATANAIEHTGAKPVFCDIDLSTYNIDCGMMGALVTEKTRAVIPVHLFGLSADMDAVMGLAKKHGFYVIEDAACGFGGYYKGRHTGTMGHVGCFSFHPRKAITTGEGGMATSLEEAVHTRIASLRDHGAVTSDLQRHLGNRPYAMPEIREPGFNYRMTDIQAALGLSQLEKAGVIMEARKAIADRYDKALAGIPWLKKPARPEGCVHGFQSYVCLFEPEAITMDNVGKVGSARNAFMEHLLEQGIATRPGTHAVHALEYYRTKYALAPTALFNSLAADRCTVSLPLFPGMTDAEFDHVIQSIERYTI